MMKTPNLEFPLFILLTALAIGGCHSQSVPCGTEPELVEACQSADNGFDCVDNGGTWGTYGYFNTLQCDCPSIDEGCICVTNQDCRGGVCSKFKAPCAPPSDPFDFGTCRAPSLNRSNLLGQAAENEFECDD